MSREDREHAVLTIDQGNSSSKAVVWQGREAVETLRLSELGIEGLLPVMEGRELDGCAFCSVAHNDAKFLETLRRLLDGRLVVVTPSVPLPVEVRYGSRRTLGADRIAAAVGASALFPGEALLVVDAGTAMTLDFTAADGAFLGGNISPGMRMRFEALHAYTSRLPLVGEEGELPEFGHNTDTAIRCGVVRGLAGEIMAAWRQAQGARNTARVVITGSDAAVLQPLLEKEGVPVANEPNLVGRGLLEIFEYNSKI